MPRPHDVPSLSRVLGMVICLAKFLPNLLDARASLCELEKKDIAWHSSECHQAVWEEVKRLIAYAPVLRYHDLKEELSIQCDTSQSGLGVALPGFPTEFFLVVGGGKERRMCPVSHLSSVA